MSGGSRGRFHRQGHCRRPDAARTDANGGLKCSWFAVRGSRFAVRGSRFVVRGSSIDERECQPVALRRNEQRATSNEPRATSHEPRDERSPRHRARPSKPLRPVLCQSDVGIAVTSARFDLRILEPLVPTGDDDPVGAPVDGALPLARVGTSRRRDPTRGRRARR